MTASNAGFIPDYDEKLLSALKFSADTVQRTQSEGISSFMKGWFSLKVSAEPMTWGIANEAPVLEYFSRKTPLVVVFHEVRMHTLLEHPHLACSPDEMAIIKGDSFLSDCVKGLGNIQFSDN